ncbi:carboxymuconolactone decarboxylase family protein [Bacteroides sp.]|uniref:carboxymuconolactone decarboxylase family protein n=1 Tax=Bacteroides sp. TaxID=29523 RepID=UPI002602A3BC|nr:carboxymuconolactone decarboxylase family protein [Bacteroides sp.]MDD3036651.1 carboxymuconolactone decarboxylase family protein [Bacteroides sp.]
MKKIILLMLTTFLTLSVSAEADQGMDKKQPNIIAIASLTGKGELDKLKTALEEGLDIGMTVNDIKEVLVHTYTYCGFPQTLRGLQTFVAILEERNTRGIEDVQGREASSITDTRTKHERGRDILSKISGVPANAPKANYAVLASEIEVFLKEHLFTDVFERDVLTYSEREIATVSVLVAIGRVEPMMRWHINISLHIGVTPDQLRHLFSIVEKQIGCSEADARRIILNEILQNNDLVIKPETPVTKMENSVKTQKVIFQNRFLIDLVGGLYFPVYFDSSKKCAAIICGHPFGGVKEQTAGFHARKLAELGYVTLAFDASYYGESGGYPRHIESPEVHIEDFSTAVDFLSNHPAVYTEQIGVLGICGGGYSVSAVQIDHRIKAVATISMYDIRPARRQGVGNATTYEQRMAILDQIGLQRTTEFGEGARRDIRALPEKVDTSTPQYALDLLDYYDNPARGKHSNSTAYYSYTSLGPMMNFLPFAQIETISPRPLLFTVGEKAVSAYCSKDVYQKAAELKELLVIPGATYINLYDRPEYSKITHPKQDIFFRQNLK